MNNWLSTSLLPVRALQLLLTVPFCCILLFHQLPAQSVKLVTGYFPGEYLLPLNNGFTGVNIEGKITWITRYSNELKDEVTTGVPDLNLLDVALVNTGKGGNQVMMLALPSGKSTLFRVDNSGESNRPVLTSVWQDSLPGLRRLIPMNDGGLIVWGDSAVVVLSADFHAFKVVARGEILSVVVDPYHQSSVLIAQRNRPNVILRQIDAVSGNVSAERELPSCRRLDLNIIHSESSTWLLAITEGTQIGIYALPSLEMKKVIPSGGEILAVTPIQGQNSGSHQLPNVNIIQNRYPEPGVLSFVGGELTAHGSLEYPLGQIVRSVRLTKNHVFVIGIDSTTVYDSELQLLEVLKTGEIGSDPRVHELQDGRATFSGFSGTAVVIIGQQRITWIQRYWRQAAAIGGLVLVLVVLIIFIRRYRYRDIVYQTLVRVPNSHGVIITNRKGIVRYINPSAREMLDIDPVIPLGRNVLGYFVGDSFAETAVDVRKLCSAGIGFERRTDYSKSGTTYTLMFRGRPMIGRFGVAGGYLLTVEDITRTLEKERLVNWASVAHHIAHEMKTPLGTIRLTAENLRLNLTGRAASPENIKAIERIVGQSERLRGIVNDLMTIARAETLHKHNVDLALALRTVADDIAEEVPETTTVQYVLNGEDFRCEADLEQIHVAVRNLLDNARYAIGDRAEGIISLILTAYPNSIHIYVQDNGIGMSSDTLSRIFQPFYTERQGGSGIGTVLVKRVIEAHGGSVSVESNQGIGSKFTLILPRNLGKQS